MEVMEKHDFFVYFAGFVDGDGCFQLLKHKNDKVKVGYTWDARLDITQWDKPFLTMLKKELGRGSIQGNHPHYVLTLSAGQLYYILPSILPFLRKKRKQAELLYQAIKMKRHVSRRYGSKTVDAELHKLAHQIKMLKPKYKYAKSNSDVT